MVEIIEIGNLGGPTGPAGPQGPAGSGTTPADGSVTNVKMANMATGTIKGRSTAGTGVPEDLTGALVTALLSPVTSGAKGVAPASGGGTTNFLRADGTWAEPAGGGGGGAPTGPAGGSLAGTYPDPTLAANSVGSAQITDDTVSNAELMNMAANTIKGAISAGDPVDLTANQATGVIASASGGGVTNFLRADGTWAAPAGGGGGLAAVSTTDSAIVDFSGDGTSGMPLTATIIADSITATEIAANAIGNLEMNNNAVGAVEIVNDAVLNTKLANMANNTIKGCITAGDPVDLTAGQATTVISSGSGGGTTNFLRADGTWSAPPGGGALPVHEEGTQVLAAPNKMNFIGSAVTAANDGAGGVNVTITGGAPSGNAGGSLSGTYPNPTLAASSVSSTQITNGSIINGDLAQKNAGIVLGRVTAGTGDIEDLSNTQLTTLINPFTDVLKGAVPSGGSASTYLRGDATWVAPPAGNASTVVVVPAGDIVETNVQAALEGLDTRTNPISPRVLARAGIQLDDDFAGEGTKTAPDYNVGKLGWTFATGSTGTCVFQGSSSLGLGVLQLGTGVSTTGWTNLHLGTLWLDAVPVFDTEFWFRPSIVSDGTNSFNMFVGLHSGVDTNEPTGAGGHGFYFKTTQALGANWRIVVRNAGTATEADSGVAADSVAIHRFRITGDGTNIRFYIDDVETTGSPITTNIPVAGNRYNPSLTIAKTLGGAARVLQLDYFFLWAEKTR